MKARVLLVALLAVPLLGMGDEAPESRELTGTIEAIDMRITAIRVDAAGNAAAEDPILSLALAAADGERTNIRWDEDTVIRNPKGKELKKVTVGENFKEGDRAVITVVDRSGTLWATEIRLQKR